MRVRLGDSEAHELGEAVPDARGEGEVEALSEAVPDARGEKEVDVLGEGVPEADKVPVPSWVTEALGEEEGEGAVDTVAEGENDPPANVAVLPGEGEALVLSTWLPVGVRLGEGEVLGEADTLRLTV